MGLESAFEGVVDLIRMEAVYFEGEKGDDVVRKPIPDQYKDAAESSSPRNARRVVSSR
jgi:elongation factor G